MAKQRAELSFIPLSRSFFSEGRLDVLAKERGEDVDITSMKFLRVVDKCFGEFHCELTRSQIQLAARLPLRAPWFADELVAVDLATDVGEGRYRIAGADERLAAVDEGYTNRSAHAKRAADARWAKERETDARACSGNARAMPKMPDETIQEEKREEEGAAASRPPSSFPPPAAPAPQTDLDLSSDPDSYKPDTGSPPISIARAKSKPRAKLPDEPTLGSRIWEAYADAYEARYTVPPVRDATANALCKRFGSRLGVDAPEVARHFVKRHNAYYIGRGHDLAVMVQDAPKLHTEWKSGRIQTTDDARRSERKEGTMSAVEAYLAEGK